MAQQAQNQQTQEETSQAGPTSRQLESPSYYLRHPEEPIPQSVKSKMPARILEKIKQERSRRARTNRHRGEGGTSRFQRSQESLLNASQAKSQERSANLVMRGDVGLTGAPNGSTSIADVDGDGNQDILITGPDENNEPTATLYLGNGQGSFSKAGADLTGVRGGSTSIADVDGDGNQDLLITGSDENNDPTATLYLGNGQGGFEEASAGLTGVSGFRGGSTSIADVDRDGNQDILITGNDENDNPTATLYLGDREGGFTEAGAGLTGVREGSTSIADVDGDGNQDLLIAGNGKNGRSTTLYLGDGEGSFTEAGAGLIRVGSSSTSIADVNGDENQDLLITGTGENGEPTARLYLGDGRGEFFETRAGLTGVGRFSRGGSTSIADVDGDGNQDLLITGPDESNRPTATLYLGDGQGEFSEAGAGLTGVEGGSTSIEDIDGDGDPDLLITGLDALTGLSSRVYINRQVQSSPNRAPTFARSFEYDRTLAPEVTLRRTIEAGDLDGDSLSIEVASGPSSVSVSDRGNGVAEVTFTPDRDRGGNVVQFTIEARDPSGAAGSFSVSVEVSQFVAAFSAGLNGVDKSSTSIADVNEDGSQDLLITGRDENFDPSTTLYLRNSLGGFTEAGAGLAGVGDGSTSIADVNGDGNQDLLIAGFGENGESATLYLGDGQGGFTEAGAGLTGVGGFFGGSSTSIADVDGDGNQDLLITGSDENNDPTATLYLGNGSGGFTEAGAGLTGVGGFTEGSSTSIADVDRDGNQDILITGNDENDNPTATLYLGDREGGFTEAGAGLTGVREGSTSIADVDGDGNQDLLITDDDENFDPSATLYLGDGEGGFTEAGAGLTGVREGSTSIADVDGDGNQDLVIAGFDGSGPTATLYLGDGQGGFSEAGAGLTDVISGSVSTGDIDGDADPDLLITGSSIASLSESATLYENLFDDPLSYPEEVATDTTRSFGDASGPGDYRLVALPGQVNRPIGETLSGEAGAEWQVYRDDGSSFVKFDGTDAFNLKAGNGFWVTSRQDWTVSETFQTVALSGSQSTTVPLNGESEWTIVSNPFDRDVAWGEVLSENGLDVPLWRYDASDGFVQADVMRSASTGTAYYVFNETGIVQLTIPYRAPSGSKSGNKAVPRAQNGFGGFSISARPASGDGPPSTVKVGLGRKETHAAPPGRFEPVSLRLTPPSSDRALMVMRRPTEDGSSEGRTFALRLTSRVDGPVEIEAEDLDKGESESAALLRPETGESHDLRRQETVTVGPEGKTVELKVAVGSAQYVEGRAEQVVPQKVSLTSYPNPVRRQGTLEYALPEAQEVTLEVYDVLGRRVATLERGRKKAGRHTARLETSRLSSGVYFGRLEAGGQTRTQKITVVR